jgi:hypothetical protein
VTREDLLLLLAGGAEEGPYDFDPIRMMKGSFIVSQAGRTAWRTLFSFRPYDYGPFDVRVYGARDALVAEGLLQREKTGRYASYTLTDNGRQRVQEVEQEIGPEGAEWVRRVGRYVTSKSFSRLLDEVYARWPEFAERSVVRQ